jgi:hypothetical protein
MAQWAATAGAALVHADEVTRAAQKKAAAEAESMKK